MKTNSMVLGVSVLVGCGGDAGSSLAFDASGAVATHVDASGDGASDGASAYVVAGGWTLSVGSQGSLALTARDGTAYSTAHGGACDVSLDDGALSGTFECTGLTSQRGTTIDVKNGHFTAARASSAGGGTEQGDPCKSGLPDLYCAR